MRKFLWIPLLALLGVGTVSAANDVKIAFVNSPLVLEKSPQAEMLRNTLQTEFAPRDAKLVEEARKLEQLEAKLKRDGAIMSAEEQRKLERDILAQQRELARAREEFKDDLNLRRNEELAKMQREIVDVINKIAKEQGYDLVLDAAAVIYASERVDLTETVLQRLHNEAKQPQ